MIKFNLIDTEEKSIPLQNRVVEHVCKSITKTKEYGNAMVWRGAVENEYFSIMFVEGTLIVSVVEREYQLGQISCNYAETDESVKINGEMESLILDDTTKRNLRDNYVHVIAPREQQEITFNDVLPILKWKLADNVRIHEDFLNN